MQNSIEYLNENLAPGNWGYFFVVLSFGTALLSTICYFLLLRSHDAIWKTIGRVGFYIHSLSVVGIFSMLFYLMLTHQFQYNYVWSHTSLALPSYYMIASFWEGQEGSFLLWTFWHCVLGIILLFTAKKWEPGVMLTLCFVQLMLTSMLLGISELSLFGLSFQTPLKIGSNPFILMREAMPNMPLFSSPDYVSKIADGRGLNVLLQNYWMVIHPPILFLGFASTTIPFCYAMASLFNRNFTEWVKPTIPWSLFNGMVLGTGILMGGAWAYEALSFGGFWAWDPVENASLVPWIIAIAALHTLVIYNARKTSLSASYILVCAAFLLILYSTFLTRSGILGDSSVHSFTDLGLSGQLLIFMLSFLFLFIIFIIREWKRIPKSKQEESTYSREFWMFLGALLLSLSALHIISVTSIKVINKITGLINDLLHTKLPDNLSAPTDAIAAYHQLQIPFAIVIIAITAYAQHLKYLKSDKKTFYKKLGALSFITILLALPICLLSDFSDGRLFILITTSVFGIVGNADILIGFFKKGKILPSGAAVAHIGIALVLIGATLSNGLKEVISINTEGFQVFNNEDKKEQRENKILYKDFPVKMMDYKVIYQGDSFDKDHIYYKVHYQKTDSVTKKITEEFDLHPYVVYDKAQAKITAPSPDTRHYLSKDIFTHITAAVDKNSVEYQVVYDTFFTYHITKGQTIVLDSFKITLLNEYVNESEDKSQYKLTLGLSVTDGLYTKTAEPSFVFKGKDVTPEPYEIHDFGLKFIYRSVDGTNKSHELIVLKGNRPTPDFITLKAIVFPWINVLWLGSLVMIIGFFMSILNRVKNRGAVV